MMGPALALAGVLTMAPPAVAAPSASLITVQGAMIRPTSPGQPVTAAYMTLVSRADRPLRLRSVECGCAEMVAAHESKIVDGVMQMRPADTVVVPPHGSVSFRPGGLHLMVMNLKHPIHPGDRVPMRLSFDSGTPLSVRFLARK